MTRMTIFLLASVITLTGYSQTSEDNPRLKKALQQYPQADADKDGILTLAEAQAFKKKAAARRKQGEKAKDKQEKSAAASAPAGGVRHVYKAVGDVKLPLYIYSPDGHKAENSTPAIVFFFGGGWRNGSPRQFEHQCKYLASRGMVGITVEYRVSSRHGVKVEDCIEDTKSAMRWVRQNAAKLGIDPDRIGSGGGSAGGHLGACVAVIDDFNAKTDDLTVSPKPNAMVLFNPAVGLSKEQMAENDLDKPGKRTHGPVAKVFPLTYADKEQAPCIMFFGTADRLLQGAEEYEKISKAAGNDCKIVTYEGQGHGFFNHGKAGGKYFDLTVAEMDKFLVKLGWLAAE